MPYQLENDHIRLTVDAPLENYSFSRFDWTGKITQVWYKGTPLTDFESKEDRDKNTLGCGFYNEFGIVQAIGFHEAQEGDWFPKIGVGLLRKEGSEYDFTKAYEIIPADFEVKCLPNELHITCRSQTQNGYAYLLEKRIVLNKSGFTLYYSLRNTGNSDLKTREYNHNFLAIDGTPINENYQLSFPFSLETEGFGEVLNPKGKLQFLDRSIQFSSASYEQFFVGNLSGGVQVPATWEMQHLTKGIGIREKASFSTSSINLWGWGHVVSPELFYDIDLKPGKELHWHRAYECFDVAK